MRFVKILLLCFNTILGIVQNLRAALGHFYQIPPESINQDVLDTLHKMLLERKTLQVHNFLNHEDYTLVVPAHQTLAAIIHKDLVGGGHISSSTRWLLGYRNRPGVMIPLDTTPFELDDSDLILVPPRR